MTERSIKHNPEPSEWDNIRIPKARTKSGMFRTNNKQEKIEFEFPCIDPNCHCKKIDEITLRVTNEHFDEIKSQMELLYPGIKIKLSKITNEPKSWQTISLKKVQNEPEKEKQEGLPAEVSNSSDISNKNNKKFSFIIIPKLTECEICQHEFEKNKISCSDCPYYFEL